jgi:hypothetical protein
MLLGFRSSEASFSSNLNFSKSCYYNFLPSRHFYLLILATASDATISSMFCYLHQFLMLLYLVCCLQVGYLVPRYMF